MSLVLDILLSKDREGVANLPFLFREAGFDAAGVFPWIWQWLIENHREVGDTELASVLTYFNVAPLEASILLEKNVNELTLLLRDERIACHSGFALWLNRVGAALESSRLPRLRLPRLKDAIGRELAELLLSYATGERPSAWGKLFYRYLLFFPFEDQTLARFKDRFEKVLSQEQDGDIRWAVGEISLRVNHFQGQNDAACKNYHTK